MKKALGEVENESIRAEMPDNTEHWGLKRFENRQEIASISVKSVEGGMSWLLLLSNNSLQKSSAFRGGPGHCSTGFLQSTRLDAPMATKQSTMRPYVGPPLQRVVRGLGFNSDDTCRSVLPCLRMNAGMFGHRRFGLPTWPPF